MQKPLTQKDIVDDLKRLGLERGTAVEVHSSLSSLGFVEGGASTVISALMDVVGEDGAIVMSAYLVTPLIPLTEEEKRKVRISAGAYQSIGYLKKALNFFKHPLFSFQYIFRRLFRWILCPLLIIVLLITNVLIVAADLGNDFYSWFLLVQIIFYLLALIGWLFVRRGKSAGILNIPFYFVFMNYCLLKGFFVFMRGRQTVLWEKSIRESVPVTLQ